MVKKLLGLLFFFTLLLQTSSALASEPWPGEPWTESTILTTLDPEFSNNLSGAHWNNETEILWVCLNGPGKFWAITGDGQGGFEIDSQGGKLAKWAIPGDIEGITQVNLEEPAVYIISERDGFIRKYDTSIYGNASLIREWNISPYIPTYSGGRGPEGIVFVPDNWLLLNGFTDGSGQPYTSQNGMGGLIFVAHQNGGRVYAFDLDPDSSHLDLVGSYKTSQWESSGLEFDRSSGNLYIWHNINGNFLEVTDLTSYLGSNGERHFTKVKEYNAPKGGNLEGIALTPASSDFRWFFTTDDDNQDGAALMWFNNFVPELMGNDTYSTYENRALDIDAPGLLQNDLGTDSLILLQEPLHGSLHGLSINDIFDGSFVYEPNQGYSGPDEFVYGSNTGSGTAKVKLNVRPVKTVTKSVSSSMDDVEEYPDGRMYTNSSDLELVRERAVQTVGLRFNTLDIPKNAEILGAHIQFSTDETSSEETGLIIHGEDSSNAPEFTKNAFDLTNRNITTANIEWQPPAWNIINEVSSKQKTPDIANIVQEIVDGENWKSGNSMVFVITGSGKRTARSFDKSASLAPRLTIEYAVPEDQIAEPSLSAIEAAVTSSTDDAEEFDNGRMYINSSDLELVDERSNQHVGIRFSSVDIPRGVEVMDAYIQFTVDEVSTSSTSLLINGEAEINPPTFTTEQYNIKSRIKTIANVSWAPAAWSTIGENGTDQRTPNISNIVQELINKSDWQSKNSMVFIITGSGKRTAESFDGSPLLSPKLVIKYKGIGDQPIVEPETKSIDVRISSSIDDAEEFYDGKIYTDSSDLEFIHDYYFKTDQFVGLRFASVNIPAGAKITKAYLQFGVDEATSESTSLLIEGEASSNAAIFTTDPFNISTREKTTANISWSPVAWNSVGDIGSDQRTPDLTNIVQEIIDNQNWSAENSIVFIVSGSGRRTAESFDGNNSLAPLLHVEYQ